MSKTTNKFSPEVRERAVWLVLDSLADRAIGSGRPPYGQHGSRWQAVMSIAAKIGCWTRSMVIHRRGPVHSQVRPTLPKHFSCVDSRRQWILSHKTVLFVRRRTRHAKSGFKSCVTGLTWRPNLKAASGPFRNRSHNCQPRTAPPNHQTGARSNLCVIRGALVGIDGEMRAMGLRPDASPWTIAVEAPDRDRRAPHSILTLQHAAMATSGDYGHWVTVQGRHLSHTMDPRRGAPLLASPASVTVTAPTCAEADAWATALMVMGIDG